MCETFSRGPLCFLGRPTDLFGYLKFGQVNSYYSFLLLIFHTQLKWGKDVYLSSPITCVPPACFNAESTFDDQFAVVSFYMEK